MAQVWLEAVAKSFGAVRALRQTSLEIQNGEFLTILGPSGSGKSTLLRLIAGLEKPDSGRIAIGDQLVCGDRIWVPPQQRDLGMVFQHYALWPHMTAFENVAFPLRVIGLSATEIASRVQEILALVELTELETKRPGEMSGGEQQRVALARALVGRPSILLMDECLSNLDARLREKMAGELRYIQEVTGVTTIYVTHDQHEALALSDRIAVLQQGTIQQIGTPGELYCQPRNALVAKSLGPVNLLSLDDLRRLELSIDLPHLSSDDALVGVRPENVQLVPVTADQATPESNRATQGPESSNQILGTLTKSTFMGNAYHYWFKVQDCTLHARLSLNSFAPQDNPTRLSPGDQAGIIIDPSAWIIFEDG